MPGPLDRRRQRKPRRAEPKPAIAAVTYSASEAAKLLGESRRTVIEWCSKGRIKTLPRIGRNYRIPASEIERLT